MLYDCFPFFNEVELLEIRLNVLKDVVDRFLIVEAMQTHSGNSKETILDKLDWLEDFDVEFVIVDLQTQTPWGREQEQREALKFLIPYDNNKADYYLVSDLDELPDPDVIDTLGVTEPLRITEDLYYFYLNASAEQTWTKGTMLLPNDVMVSRNLTDLRVYGDFESVHGGWHWSSLGGAERVDIKLRNFAHTELSDAYNRSRILKNLKEGRDIHGAKLTKVPIDDRFPDYIRENQEQWPSLIL